ncbi:hypothetical protein F4778DRAFT_746986 [Xylariomycetidae sp. FL2044]|nr:hypothetical protein F4778DRAFT_746986 [Xylariomycetidae sp. FL2044]
MPPYRPSSHNRTIRPCIPMILVSLVIAVGNSSGQLDLCRSSTVVLFACKTEFGLGRGGRYGASVNISRGLYIRSLTFPPR